MSQAASGWSARKPSAGWSPTSTGWSPPIWVRPDSDDDWFVTDWMDTARAQHALSFQHHLWPDMLAEMHAIAGWRRYPMRVVGPVVRQLLKRRAAYRNAPGRFADPWGAIRAQLGEPWPDINGRSTTPSQRQVNESR